jgi:Spy/CpxP family protein refolding chaperone
MEFVRFTRYDVGIVHDIVQANVLLKERFMGRWQSWVFGIAIAGSCMLAQAQGPGVAPPPPPGAPPRRSLEALSELRMLTQQLNLTPDQREKLRPIVTEEGEQLHVVRIDERMTPDQKRAKVFEIREAFNPKIAAELTPEQQEKWKKLEESLVGKRPEAAKEPAKPGTPAK